FRGIHPLLRGAGPLPGGCKFLAEVERASRPPAEASAATRRQHPGPVQPGDLHVAVAALAGAELSLPSHLRTMRWAPGIVTASSDDVVKVWDASPIKREILTSVSR